MCKCDTQTHREKVSSSPQLSLPFFKTSFILFECNIYVPTQTQTQITTLFFSRTKQRFILKQNADLYNT